MDYPLVTSETTFETVILGNGDFPHADIPLAILGNAKYICCCDGAGEHLVNGHGIIPHAIVGDGDSIPPDFKEQYKDIVHVVNEQENNDLTKATLFCAARGMRRMAYLGVTGKREDHTVGNISLMLHYVRNFGLDVTLITDYGYFVVAHGNACMRTFAGQQVSIFNITCSRLCGSGLKWDTYAYKSLWQGTLNEATGDAVTFKTDGEFMVFRTFFAKKS